MNRFVKLIVTTLVILLSSSILLRIYNQTQASEAPQQSRSMLYLPIMLHQFSEPTGGACIDEWHLVNRATGAPSISHNEERSYNDSDYACVPNESCADFPTVPFGSCQDSTGVVGYSCEEGYVGDRCQYCAPGYELSTAEDRCVLEAVPTVDPPVIMGHFDAVAQGETRTLRATGINADNFVWEIVAGPGCFEDAAGGCGDTAIGATAVFVAPVVNDDLIMTDFRVGPPCCGDPMPPSDGVIITNKPQGIPVNGYGNSQLVHLLRVLNDFMIHRCIGATTVGVSYYGEVVGVYGLGRMDGRAALDGWDDDCGNDPYVEAASNVRYDTPQTIGSNSKAVANAVARWVVRTALEEEGIFLSDNEIENLLIFGENPALPDDFQFFPDDLHDLYSGVTTPPVMFSDSEIYTRGDPDGVPFCDDLDDKADPKWLNVTFGDLLAHRTGQQGVHVRYYSDVMVNLDQIRGLSSEADYEAQEQTIRDTYGNSLVDDALNLLNFDNAYFVPRPTLHDILVAQAGRCLRYNVGQYEYANADQWYLDEMVRYLDPSGLMMAADGFPDTHENSAMDRFFADELGISTTSSDGIFRVQTAYELGGYIQPLPVRREWHAPDNTNYFLTGDNKRPFCLWSNGNCSFAQWQNNPSSRINWPWEQGLVPFNYATQATSGAAGALTAEVEDYLEFMNNYWVSGYGVNPASGQSRDDVWSFERQHAGAYNGTFSWVIQYGNTQLVNPSMNLLLPPLTANGRLTDEYESLEPISCTLPDGLDIFVAVNQWGDKKCEEGDYCDGLYSDIFNDVLRYGLCQANWAALTLPELP